MSSEAAIEDLLAPQRFGGGVALLFASRASTVSWRTVWRLVTGALASVALTRVAARFLFGIETGDWLPAAAAAGLVLALALLATWLPARRAGRVDPATVLSAE